MIFKKIQRFLEKYKANGQKSPMFRNCMCICKIYIHMHMFTVCETRRITLNKALLSFCDCPNLNYFLITRYISAFYVTLTSFLNSGFQCFKNYIVSIVSLVGGNRDHDPTNIV